MIIITGASDNHFLSLINFMNSFVHHNSRNNHSLIVYNLGIEASRWATLQTTFLSMRTISFKTFDYTKYPEWFNININAGEYAWKPTIIYNTFIENPTKTLVWMDSGNLIKNDLKDMEIFLEINGVYSATSLGTISDWTYIKTINYLDCTWTKENMRNAACIGFNPNKAFAKELLIDFYKYSHIKECICPEGSSRANHRQDQSVFSVLFYKKIKNQNVSICNHYLGYSIHNDVD